MTNEKHFPKIISQWEFDFRLFTNLPRIIVARDFSPSSYFSWQNTYPNLKTTCHAKLHFFSWTKLLENLLLAKYLMSVTAPLNNFFGSFHSNIRSDMFYKIVFKNFGKLKGKRLCWSFFLIKLYVIKPATLIKRDFNSDVLLWILRNCFKHLFYRTPPVSVSHFNSTFLTLSLRRTYIYIFQALLGFRYF